MASPRQSLAFGVEIEVYLRPRDSATMRSFCDAANWDPSKQMSAGRHRAKLLQVVQAALNNDNIPAVLEAENGHTEWLIEGDGSLASGEIHGYYWSQKVLDLYEVISTSFDVRATQHCGMHVHISPAVSHGLRWTAAELRSILKAICLYNDSVVDILPPDRKANEFAAPNFSHEQSPDAVQSLHAAARNTGDYGPLFGVIDGLQTPGAFAELFETRWWSFNFSNISDTAASCGTIEFRSPPAAPNAHTAMHWAVWTLSFVAEALRTDWSSRSREPWNRAGAVAGLRQFILRGYARLPAPSRTGLDVSRLRRITGDAAACMTAAEIAEVKALKEKKLVQFGGR
ncbi:hypothetical protein F503_06927 [Ophiostoma piceae UAMH 11346]|uniref:Amidoligase enzyme n=1 Tax=Ophiostoma piceae (strain UAMH 11346) TaxID=1262450 RepID=S3CB46_OPHP1|nr:hypothetical protein F503_06927 [Ophiostoma piceae UAMH 11346]